MVFANIWQNVSNLNGYELEILSGSHKDLILIFPPGTYSVGSQSSNDVILFGDNVGRKHFHIKFPESIFSQVSLMPRDSDIQLDDERTIIPGQICLIGPANTFYCNCVKMRVRRIIDRYVLGSITSVLLLPLLFWIITNFNIVTLANDDYNSVAEYEVAALPSAEQLDWGNLATSDIPLIGLSFGLKKVRYSNVGGDVVIIRGNVSFDQEDKLNEFMLALADNFPEIGFVDYVNRHGYTDFNHTVNKLVLDRGNFYLVFDERIIATVGDRIAGGWLISSIFKDRFVVERDGSYSTIWYDDVLRADVNR